MTSIYNHPSGFQLLRSDDGKTAKRAEPGVPPEPGWHLMTEDEFEADIDGIIEGVVEKLVAEGLVDEEPPAI